MSQENTIEQSPSSNTPVSSSSGSFQTTDLIDTASTKPEGKGSEDVLNSSPLSPADQKALSGASQESLNGKTPNEQYFEQGLLRVQKCEADIQECEADIQVKVGLDVELAVRRLALEQRRLALEQSKLALCYWRGRGVTQDYVKAVEWYTKAAAQGSASAQLKLGECYEYGRGVTQDYVKAVEWYTKAAAQGSASAQLKLGECYEYGRGVTQDYVKAVEWYTKAVAQGHAQAQNNLGMCYRYGRGVTQDYVKAVEWYAKAVAQGNTDAQFNLGVCYRYGRGVTQDYVKAVEWYAKAVAQGNTDAQNNLGVCYELGRGVTKNETKAVEWYSKASAQGNADAQFNLGRCYEDGRGVTKNETKAVEWYSKASAQGSASAQARLDEINRRRSVQVLSALPKAEVKQEVSGDDSSDSSDYEQNKNGDSVFDPDAFSALPKAETKQEIDSDSDSEQEQNKDNLLFDFDELFPATTTDRETKESKSTSLQTEVSQLTTDIQQGDTATLSKALATPAAQQSEPIQNYLQSQAIWTVLESEAKPTQKAEQIALLVETPGVSLLVENDQGQRPLDVALQQFSKGQINGAAVQKLQDATQKQLAEEEDYIFSAIEAYAQTTSADVSDEKASSYISTADPEDGPITPQQLAAKAQKLHKADESLQQQFKAVSLSTPQPSTSSSHQPPPLTKPLRKVQKKAFLDMVNLLISKKFITSVAVGQGWVEEVSTKTAAAVETAVTTAAEVLVSAVPGGGMVVAAGKKVAKWAYHNHEAELSRKHTFGITSLKQLATVTNYIEQGLLHRYQNFLLQQNLLLPKEAMETFVNCLIERMCLYVEKIEGPEQIIPMLGGKLVNLNRKKNAGQMAGSDIPFTDTVAAQLAENLVAATSLLHLDLKGRLIDKIGSGSDALISCCTTEGGIKKVRVNDICHSPAVTLTEQSEQASFQVNTVADDLEYEGRHLPGSTWAVGECGVTCVSREEAEIEELHATTRWRGDLLVMKDHWNVTKLRARAEAAEARANSAETEVTALKAKVDDLEQQVEILESSHRSLGQQLFALGTSEAAEAKVLKPQRRGAIAPGDPKSPANHRSKGGPGMFDSKLNAAGKPIKPLPPISSFQPVSPKPQSGLSSTPTTPAGPVR